MKLIATLCLCKPCPGVCLHKRRHEGIDVSSMADPFRMLLCGTCWAYRIEWE